MKPKQKNFSNNDCQVQIQFGRYKGKILKYRHVSKGLRPTLARARDVLFNWLPRWDGLLCCDLFAGTGILGIQSLCLGASKVVFVEPDRDINAQLGQHIKNLGFEQSSELISQPVETIYNLLPQDIDRVFLDPPFENLELYYDLVARSDFADKLRQGALLYVELPKDATLSPFQIIVKHKQVGDVSIYLVHDCRKMP